ncbi:MAG: hypothetical protein FD187_764 [bacterium]|nr:MAG: hypothetical protein FD142_659 [bacterium]KAF0149807.1 MAG: hypothetical protein FD187_764 [bacterium]KAF0168508.1 MAG: hypothetical protein FD158_1228 [bacterium]TXT19559.1 MAG: hypothetical protein FD132_1693 [bacterium]
MTAMPDQPRFVGAPSGANSAVGQTAFAPEGAPTVGEVLGPEGVPVGEGVLGMVVMAGESCFVGAPSGANSSVGQTAFAPEGAPTGDRFRGSALRKGRWSGDHQAYLITTVTHGREPLLAQPPCARAVVQGLRGSALERLSHTHAFVVMPDHVHWLMTLCEGSNLSRTVGKLKGITARRINALLGRQGAPVWQHGFHDHALRGSEDMRDIARYVVANPLRAGLVDRLGDYPWWDAERL